MPRSTWDTSRVLWNFVYEAFTLYGVSFQILLLSLHNPTLRSRNPFVTYVTKVWALPSSLAATKRISVISFPQDT